MIQSKPHSRKRIFVFSLITIILISGTASVLIAKAHAKARASTLPLVKDENVVAPDAGSFGTDSADVGIEVIPAPDTKPVITTYTVKTGDTLSSIAETFNISQNTIRWANDLNGKAVLKVGQSLTILPITGIEYTVKSGDTLGGIALKFDANQAEISEFNDIENGKLKVGAILVIPDAEPTPVPKKAETKPIAKPVVKTTEKVAVEKVTPAAVVKETESKVEAVTSESATTKVTYSMPVPGALLTQGIHGANGVDFGTPVGSAVRAAAAGNVIVAKGNGGYNGGYGNYIVIEHPNGTQTLYAHLSKVEVSVGDSVDQNDHIALSGNTGKSTGPHLHFEVRGATNPFGDDKLMTHY